MKIAFIILAHQDPGNVARLAQRLVEDGGLVALHYDLNARSDEFVRLKQALGPLGDQVLWPDRVRVTWGQWSIVAATLNALEVIERSGARVDYVHLMSGTDYPIRPLSQFRDYLARVGGDFIECADMAKERWVKDGLTHERYRYRHPFNWRTSPRAFDACWALQRKFGLQRRFPTGLRPHLGSQWWTLTWQTCRLVLEAGRNPAYRRFFRSVWIPDEMFIQSIIGSKVAAERRRRHCLTLFQFTDRGKPVVFANDHADYLTRQPFFFARKLSRHAAKLRDDLDLVIRGLRSLAPVMDAAVGQKSNEYERVRLAGGKPVPGRRIMGQDGDKWRGDLLWNTRPFVAVVGASHDELGLIQQVLAASGAMVCHGALFDPRQIHFARQARRFAGYGRNDIKLRDHRRTTFLSDVIMASAPLTTGLLLPWQCDEGIRDVVLWSRQACVLIVRGNVFRAFLEHRARELDEAAATAPVPAAASRAAKSWVAPLEFDLFYKAHEDYYRYVAELARNSGVVCQHVELMEGGWLQKVHHFLDCAVPPGPHDRGAVPLAPITVDWIERLALQLPDPAAAIENIRGLIELRLNAEQRVGHRECLLTSRRVGAPEWNEAVASAREQVG